jgi:hypothetical protein
MNQQVDIKMNFGFDASISKKDIDKIVTRAMQNSELSEYFVGIESIKEEEEIYGNK